METGGTSLSQTDFCPTDGVHLTKSTGDNAQSYQILGPYPCDKSFFKYCKGDTATGKTGSTIYVGAPPGSVNGLAALLNGKSPPPLNECSQ